MGKALIININNKYWTDERIEAVRSGMDKISEHEVLSTRYLHMTFTISDEGFIVYDHKHGMDLKDYEAVFLRDLRDFEFERHATAMYLNSCSVPFFNSDALSFEHISKLTQNIAFAEAGLNIPSTIYSPNNDLLADEIMRSGVLSFPLVVKAISGKNGDDNFLIGSEEELRKKLGEHRDTKFIAQEFIQNDYDYRIIVLGDQIGSVAKRTRDPEKGDHRNNVELGGAKDYIALEDMDQDILDMAVAAAKAVGRESTGVDVLVSTDGKRYVLEANYAYGMILDHDTSREIPALGEYMDKVIKDSKS